MLFSDGTPSEKYFSVGIRIFPWVFAHTEIFEFPVVYTGQYTEVGNGGSDWFLVLVLICIKPYVEEPN